MSTRRDFIKRTTIAGACLSTQLQQAIFSSPTTNSSHLKITKLINKKWGSKNKSLTLLHPKGCKANLKPITQLFYKLTGIPIKLKEGSLDKLSSEIILKNKLEGNSFDIALPATFSIPDLVESNVIEDLSSFYFENNAQTLTNIPLYSLGNSYKNKLYGFQTDGDTYVMFYNKNFIHDPTQIKKYQDQFGENLELPKTWKQLDRQVEFFHQPNQDRYGGSLYRNKEYIAWEFWVRFHAKGFYPVKDDMTPQFNNQAGVEALSELIRISKFLEPNSSKNGLFDNFKSYAEGNKYCNIGWGGTQKHLNSLNSKVKGTTLYSTLPGGTAKGKTFDMPFFNWGWNYVVSKNSVEKELAFLFCLFASTPLASTLSIKERDGYFDPYRKEHYSDPKVIDVYGKDFLETHFDSLSRSIPDFYLQGRGSYFSYLKEGIFSANLNQIKPQLALNLIAKQWETLTDRLGRENQIQQWKFLKDLYPKHLHGLLV